MHSNRFKGYLGSFILGGVVGSSLTLLFSPFSGKEFRGKINTGIDNSFKKAKERELEILNKAKVFSDDLVLKAEQLVALIDKYSTGTYLGPVEKIEKEIKSLKAAIDAAVKTYKRVDGHADEITAEETADEIFPDYTYEKLPKRESMRKRVRGK